MVMAEYDQLDRYTNLQKPETLLSRKQTFVISFLDEGPIYKSLRILVIVKKLSRNLRSLYTIIGQLLK